MRQRISCFRKRICMTSAVAILAVLGSISCRHHGPCVSVTEIPVAESPLPDPGAIVEEGRVTVTSVVGRSTARYRVGFQFEVKEWKSDPELDTLRIGVYQGADFVAGADSLTRLTEFLGATRNPNDTSQVLGLHYHVSESRVLNLKIIYEKHRDDRDALWVFENPSGDTVSLRPRKSSR